MRLGAGLTILLISATLFTLCCGRKPTHSIAELLFEEIIEAESPSDPRIIISNWTAFDALGEANSENPDDERAMSIFYAFYLARFGYDIARVDMHSMRVMCEYGGNLLLSTPENGITLVSTDEAYYLARFAQEVEGLRPDVIVVNSRYMRFEEYRHYLADRYSLDVPEKIINYRPGDPGAASFEAQSYARWVITSSGRPVFASIDVAVIRDAVGGAFIGPGRRYGEDLSDSATAEYNKRLYSRVLRFHAYSDTSASLSEETHKLVDWYGECPINICVGLIESGDTARAGALIDILVDRLPSHWQPAALRISMHHDMPKIERERLSRRIKRYIRSNPKARRPGIALENLREQRESRMERDEHK